MHGRTAWIALSVLSGLLMIALGVIFLVRPGLSLGSVLLLLGVFSIAHGAVQVIAGLMGRTESRGWAIAAGLLAVIFGIVVLAYPKSTALTLLYIIAIYLIISGIADLVGALRRELSGGQRVWLGIAGVLAIAVGIYFFANPASGALALLWLIALYLIALGILRIIGGFMKPPQAQAA